MLAILISLCACEFRTNVKNGFLGNWSIELSSVTTPPPEEDYVPEYLYLRVVKDDKDTNLLTAGIYKELVDEEPILSFTGYFNHLGTELVLTFNGTETKIAFDGKLEGIPEASGTLPDGSKFLIMCNNAKRLQFSRFIESEGEWNIYYINKLSDTSERTFIQKYGVMATFFVMFMLVQFVSYKMKERQEAQQVCPQATAEATPNNETASDEKKEEEQKEDDKKAEAAENEKEKEE